MGFTNLAAVAWVNSSGVVLLLSNWLSTPEDDSLLVCQGGHEKAKIRRVGIRSRKKIRLPAADEPPSRSRWL